MMIWPVVLLRPLPRGGSKPRLAKGREILMRARAQIATRVRDALIAAKKIGSINQAARMPSTINAKRSGKADLNHFAGLN